MTILSIDASTKSLGLAVFKDGELICYDCLTASSNDLINRIHKIILKLSKVFETFTIDKIVLEEVRPETEEDRKRQNTNTHRALMWLQAAIAFLAHDVNSKIKIDYLYPSAWRKSCGISNGRGIKRDVLKAASIAFVKEKYGIDVNDDIADAICLGYGYLHNIEEPKKSRKVINFK